MLTILTYFSTKFNSRFTTFDCEGPSDEEILSWSLWGGTNEAFSPKGKWSITVQDTKQQTNESLSQPQPLNQVPREVNNSAVPASPIMPRLHNLFHQTSSQEIKTTNFIVILKKIFFLPSQRKIYLISHCLVDLQDLIMNLLNSLQQAEVVDGE